MDKDVLYREYAEAGALCRSYEQHARASMAVFVPFSMAVLAYILTESASAHANILLAAIGLLVSLLTLSVLYRVREFNHVANQRAVEIERQLGMSLYQAMNAKLQGHWTPKNKVAFMIIVAVFGVAFLGTIVFNAYAALGCGA